MIKEAVFKWLQAGAPFAEGVRLFSLISRKGHPFQKLLQLGTSSIHKVLKTALCRRAGIANFGLVKSEKEPELKQEPDAPSPAVKLREDWPFLNDPACPPELKILAADKLTAYYKFTAAHDALFECTTPVEQFQTAKQCVENYIENRLIVSEFKYYKEHKSILGRHPVFAGLKRIAKLRKLNIVQLIKLKDNLEHAIWRIQSEIKKGDKPHLTVEREKRILDKKTQLAEVERLLKEFSS